MKTKNYLNQNTTLYALIILIIISLNRDIFYGILSAFIPFIFAYIIGTAINKTAEKLSSIVYPRKRICRIIISFGFLAIGFAVIRIIILVLSRQISALCQYMTDNFSLIIDKISEVIDKHIGAYKPDIKNEIIPFVTDTVGKITSFSLSELSKLPSALIEFGIFLCALFYFTADFHSVNIFLSDFLPENVKSFVQKTRRGSFVKIIGCIKGYLILFFMTAAELFLLFLIIKCKNAFLLAFVVAIFDLMPLFGVGTVLIPWSVFSFFGGERIKSAVLAVGFLLICLIRNFAEPKIISSKLGVHPLLTVFSAYFFFKLFGTFGLFIAPIAVITIKITFFDTDCDVHILRKY